MKWEDNIMDQVIINQVGCLENKDNYVSINTSLNEGAQCISPDGMFLVFTACNRPDGKGSCDLYFSRKVGNKCYFI